MGNCITSFKQRLYESRRLDNKEQVPHHGGRFLYCGGIAHFGFHSVNEKRPYAGSCETGNEVEENLTMEDYYTLLENNSKTEERTQKMISGSANQSQGDSDGDADGDSNGSGGCPFDNQNDAESKGINNLDNENWEQNEMVDADVKNYVSKAKDSNKSWGNITGKIVDTILVAHRSPVNWRRLVRHFGKTRSEERRVGKEC